MVPGVSGTNLTGAATWYDAQVFGADEAVIKMAASSAIHGAQVANYVNAKALLTKDQIVVGVRAMDELSGETFDIEGNLVVNAAGPWAKGLLSSLGSDRLEEFELPLVKSMNIVTKQLFTGFAVGIQSKRASDSVVGTTKRLYFFTPWQGCTIIGTTHFPYDGNPDALTAPESDAHLL